jgi:hypothetical protein
MNEGTAEETVVDADLCRDACEFGKVTRPVCDVISVLATRKTKMPLMSFLKTRICLAGPHLPNRAGLQTSDSRSE